MTTIRVARLRPALAALAATSALAALPAAASASEAYGYVWANQPATPSYTPATSYQDNMFGQLNTITRTGVGRYRVRFPSLASAVNGGTVNVTAYGAGTTHCGVANWSTAGVDVLVNVRCTDTAGALADSLFDATYAVAGSVGGPLAYVWADRPAAAAYTPATLYQFNAANASNSVTRTATGAYNVRLGALGEAAGTVKVTAYGAVSHRCKVVGWGPSAGDQIVRVACFTAAGAPVNARFTLTYASQWSPLGSKNPFAYAWANQPGAASYAPSSLYATSTFAGGPTISRNGVGQYGVTFPGIGGGAFGDVQVTAYGAGSAECRVTGWFGFGNGQSVGVACYDTTGAPVDSYYTIQFLR